MQTNSNHDTLEQEVEVPDRCTQHLTEQSGEGRRRLDPEVHNTGPVEQNPSYPHINKVEIGKSLHWQVRATSVDHFDHQLRRVSGLRG